MLDLLTQKYNKLDQKYQQLQFMHAALHKITDLAYNCQNLDEFYQQLHDIVSSLIDAENFFVAVIDEEEKVLRFVFHQDQEDENPGSFPIDDLIGSLSAIVVAKAKPLLVTPKKDRRLIAQGVVNLKGSAGIDWLGVPLLEDNKVIGLMVVQSYSNKVRYKKKDSEFLEFVASHVVTALARFNNKEELTRAVKNRTKQLEQKLAIIKKNEQLKQVLFDISELTNAQLEINQFYKRIQQILGQLLSVQNFYIARRDKDDEPVKFVYYVDPVNPNLVKQRQTQSVRGYTEHLMAHGEALLLSKDDLQSLVDKGLVDKTEIDVHSWLGVPLRQQNKIVGAMVVQSYTEDVIFTDKDAELLNFVSHHISSAIHRKDAANFQLESKKSLELQVEQRTKALREEIGQRQHIEQKLKYSASHDALTSLANRTYFYEALTRCINKQPSSDDYQFAVLFIDLDHFKKVNDRLGHHFGDKLLKRVGQSINKLIRDTDTLARIGGDEFAILLDKLSDKNIACWVAKRIVALIEKTFYINDNAINISASIGILFSDNRYQTAEDMLRDADIAMYKAKEKGKGCSEIFDASMHQKLLTTIKLEADLKNALEFENFLAYFQPIYDLATQQITGFEALARWQYDNQRLITPDGFIELAEETRLIEQIDLQILDKAAAAIKSWLISYPDQNFYVSCNLFSSHFLSDQIVNQVEAVITKYQLPKGSLAIEVTERVLLESGDVVLSNMNKLKELGVRLYLDDFGTGYSSLSYLYQYPFDVLKIDSSFIKNMRENKKYKVIVNTIISMANNLGMETVAEGIEFEQDIKEMQSLTCKYGQGYLLSKPLPKEKIDQLLATCLIGTTPELV